MASFILSLPLFALCASAGLLQARQNTSQPIVDLGYAKYRGTNDPSTGLNTYWGIRFAEKPIGNLRWKAPVPVSAKPNPSATPQDATAPGPVCVQGFPSWVSPDPVNPPGSEDCLLVNVIQPANIPKNAKLPVLVAIHGGGYTMGDANIVMPFAVVAHAKGSYLAVSIQYRLGAYGFLGSLGYRFQGGEANLGLLDQRLALEWVQKNIGAFGGDPKKVTIAGGSAGGGSVTSQLTLYGGARPAPFRGAIAQFPWWQQHLPENQLDKQFKNLLEAAKCATLKCLRELDEGALKLATQKTYGLAYGKGFYGYGSYYYGPYVDGFIIQDVPSQEFKANKFAKVAVLVDHNQYEGAAFTNQSINSPEDEARDLKAHFPRADNGFRDELNSLYPASAFNATFWKRATWFGDFIVNCPTLVVATSVSKYQPVYKLVFNAGTQLHGAINAFLADWVDSPGYNATIGNAMKDWYSSFTVNLDPNAQSWSNVAKPNWPDYRRGAKVMTVNYTQIGAVADADQSNRCKFFRENDEIVQN